jgi:hypothetical protein
MDNKTNNENNNVFGQNNGSLNSMLDAIDYIMRMEMIMRQRELENRFYEQIMLREAMNNSMETYKGIEKNIDNVIDVRRRYYKSRTEEEKKNNTRCTICLEDFNPKDWTTKLEECSHIFHYSCIKEWGMYKADCPLCNTPIRLKGDIKIN